MGTQQVSPFNFYEQSTEEDTQGRILSPQTFQRIHNMRTAYALQKVNMTYDHSKPVESAQKEAELTGQLSILTLLLQEHEDAIEQSHSSTSTI